MSFGISYVGLIYLAMLFAPNILWVKNKPKGYSEYMVKENKILLCFERCGEVLVCGTVLIFTDFNIKSPSIMWIWLWLSFISMFLYEIYWIRYFRSDRTLKDFYSSLLGIPVAGATLPVAAFILLGIYGKNLFLIASTVILGIGHIGIHICHRKEIDLDKKYNE